MNRPNILWYCTDQQRFDTIGALGNPHVQTPTLDRLVEEGVAFTHAYCQSPICTPSRSSFMTGMYPARVHNTRNGNDTFPDHPPLISKLLADAGYSCGNIGKFHLVSAGYRTEPRLDDGYSYWKHSHAPRDDWEQGHDYAEWVRERQDFSPGDWGVATDVWPPAAPPVLAGYVLLGVEIQYLLAASFMAAPGGFLMAKLLLPEAEKIASEEEDFTLEFESHINVIDAAASGASSGMSLALNVGAMVLAFVGLIALVNTLLGSLGAMIGFADLSLQLLLGYAFQPLAFIVGIPWEETRLAGSLIGQKLVFNEFVAFVSFTDQMTLMSDRSQAIVTFALCGFANFSSIGIVLGGIGMMAPNRRKDIAELGLRAVLAGFMANLMSAAIAGFFLSIG